VVDLAVDVGGARRGEVGDRGGDLLRAAGAAGRDLADAALASLGVRPPPKNPVSSMNPGATALTVTPSGPRSSASQ
jgi:hypothetical protein